MVADYIIKLVFAIIMTCPYHKTLFLALLTLSAVFIPNIRPILAETECAYDEIPYITSTKPINAEAGDAVSISGCNLSANGYIPELSINGAPLNIKTQGDTLNFTIPESSKKGKNTIELKVKNKANEYEINLDFYSADQITTDAYVKRQLYLTSLDIKSAWESGMGENVVVAVIDDGVYLNHEDLRGNFWTNPEEILNNRIDDDKNGYIDDYYGYNFAKNNNDMDTAGSHGTAVAGIIAGVKNDIGISGVAPKAKIMPLIVIDDSGGAKHSAVIKAIKYAVLNGADVINISLGNAIGSLSYTTIYDDAIRYAYENGVVVVAAAGNEDQESETFGQNLNFLPASPVCNESGENMIIGVGSLNTLTGGYANWSGFGSKCVDIYTYGDSIYTTSVAKHSGANYTYAQGTSFSAPIVAGAAALLKSANPYLSNKEIIKRISNNGDELEVHGEKSRKLNLARSLEDIEVMDLIPAAPQTDGASLAALGSADFELQKQGVIEKITYSIKNLLAEIAKRR